MSKEKWFLDRVSQQKAKDLLLASGVDGSFVIRSSETVNGAYALSVLHDQTVHTYRVLPTDNDLLAVQTLNGVQQRKFSCLDDLVREYRSPQNGLVCGLTNPVGINEVQSSILPPKELPPEPPSTKSIPTASLPRPVQPLHKSKVPPIPSARQLDSISADKQKESALARVLPPIPSRDLSMLPKDQTKANEAGQFEIQKKILNRVDDLKDVWPGANDNFLEIVRHYASAGGLQLDINNVRQGGEQCAELQALLAREAVAFQSELEIFLMKTDMLRQLFDFNLPPRKAHTHNRVQDLDVDLDTFLGRLRDCQTVVKALNKRACINVKNALGLPMSTVASAGARKQSRTYEPITVRMFEVKQDGALKFSKQKFKIDIKKATLTVIKADGLAVYDHSKVLQLIKNNKSQNKLSILFEGSKKKDYTFEQSSQREVFCQLMQYLRNKHSSSADPDCISVFCGSWNMGDAIPPNDISSWLMCNGSGKSLDQAIQNIPHDIYVIGTQETGLHERDWMHKIMETLQEVTGANFHLVVMDALWHIKIMVIVREEHKNRISHVHTSTVKTGIANALGNKGAVGVSFQFECTSFCFINAHLTSGAEKCGRRNQNYNDIVRSLNLGGDRFNVFDLTNRFDHLFFFGDLNYRLEMDVHEIIGHIRKKELSVLHNVDQMRREIAAHKVFFQFDEEDVLFPPTYRYERGTRENYSYLKVKKTGVRINVPSWCDRVLWRSYPETHNVCHAYGCSDDITTSDHSPVFSNFEVGVRSQYVSSEEISASNICKPASIIFDKIDVILKSPGKSSYYLQFYSACLTGSVKSNRNSKLGTVDVGLNRLRLTWNADAIPNLKPIISDREFLVDQHLLLSLRSEDDSEVFGECVIALRSMIGTFPQTFDSILTRKGEATGQICGKMLVQARQSQKAPKEKTYDFIQIRKDDDETKKKVDLVADVGTYSGIDDITDHVFSSPKHSVPTTSQQSPLHGVDGGPANLELGVYGEGLSMEEGKYVNPDKMQIGTSPPRFPDSSSSPTKRWNWKADAGRNVDSTTTTSNHRSPSPGDKLSGSPKLMRSNLAERTRPRSAISSSAMGDFSSLDRSIGRDGARTPPYVSTCLTPSPTSTYQNPSSISRDTFYDKLVASQQFRPQFGTGIPGKPRRPTGKQSIDEGFPDTVENFLSLIDLQQYRGPLESKGWDSIEFLGELTEEDLFEAGILNPDHCRTILDKIQDLSL